MVVVKEWDQYTGRDRVYTGGMWPVEASCVVIEGEERWMIDELPTDLSELVFMQQRGLGIEHEPGWKKEWSCSGWRPGVGGEQKDITSWGGSMWEQADAEEGFAPGVEEQLLGEGGDNMRSDTRWWQKLAQAEKEVEQMVQALP